MKKSVGCFTDEKLKELSEQPNTMVMQHTHDVVFEPWQSGKVSDVMDRIVELTMKHKSESHEEVKRICREERVIEEFAQKYQVMFEKLTTIAFISDRDNLRVVKKMILLKAAVDKGMTTTTAAQAQVSDIALTSLSSRVKNAK